MCPAPSTGPATAPMARRNVRLRHSRSGTAPDTADMSRVTGVAASVKSQLRSTPPPTSTLKE